MAELGMKPPAQSRSGNARPQKVKGETRLSLLDKLEVMLSSELTRTCLDTVAYNWRRWTGTLRTQNKQPSLWLHRFWWLYRNPGKKRHGSLTTLRIGLWYGHVETSFFQNASSRKTTRLRRRRQLADANFEVSDQCYISHHRPASGADDARA